MSEPSHGRTGVLVVTVWSDRPGPGGLRARLRMATEVTGDDQEEIVVVGADAVLAAVSRWLERCASVDPGGGERADR